MSVCVQIARPAADPAIAGRIAASGRLRLRHGPIDLIFDLCGPEAAVARAEAAARAAFAGLLDALVAELPLLRAPVRPGSADAEGPVARRMMAAVRPHAAEFITPMAAVAGAVADHMRDAVLAVAPLDRVMVNNGGDIAIHLAAGQSCRVAIGVMTGDRPATIRLTGADVIGGIATSGWRGRSHSLGIADAVTVLAGDAASADAAATLIANAVDLPGSALVTRRPATELAPDSDLGARLVTVDVAPLSSADRACALDRGLDAARAMVRRDLIRGAFLYLQGDARVAGAVPLPAIPQQEGAMP
jgi:ApbE superfamily uncharacterized protein (UPF0280 family)